MKEKYKEQPRIALDGTEHTDRTADNKFLHQNFLSGPIELQRSPSRGLSRNKHKLRGPGEKYVSASKKTQLMEKGIISESISKVWKVDSDNEGSDFESHVRSEAKPVHIHIPMAEVNKPTLALLPNRSEEDEINNNSETRDRDGNSNLRRSNRIFKPPERLGSVPYF